jgi:phosphoglycolate phosphatase
VGSAPDLAYALNELLAERGCGPLSLETVRGLIGDGAPTLVARALQAGGATFEPETYESLLERYRALYLGHATVDTRVYSQVPETLELLREQGYRTVVCTNKFQLPSLQILEAYDLAATSMGAGAMVPARKLTRRISGGLKLIGAGPSRRS